MGKNVGGCQSGLGLVVFHICVRGEPKAAGAGGPQGARLSPGAVLGLVLAHPWPTAVAMGRRVGAVTTSSSSAARAEDPSTPLGLGDRRFGDPDPDPDPEGSPAGLAMGAIGRATGPGSGRDTRLAGAGGNIVEGDDPGVCPITLDDGGPIGAPGDIPRL